MTPRTAHTIALGPSRNSQEGMRFLVCAPIEF